MYSIIKRADGAWFVGDSTKDNHPYDIFGPMTEATARALYAAETDTVLPPIEASEVILIARDRAWAEGATVWSTQNGDSADLDAWAWEAVPTQAASSRITVTFSAHRADQGYEDTAAFWAAIASSGILQTDVDPVATGCTAVTLDAQQLPQVLVIAEQHHGHVETL